MTGQLGERSIGSLLGERFHIPSYQRGYRWQTRQVRELLDDLLEFQRPSQRHEPGSFYCLQPIVVVPTKDEDDEDAWEVVDGQQRLTTLHLILGFLHKLLDAEGLPRFRLSYATRPGSAGYLDAPKAQRRDENIDFHHIWEAWCEIKRWFDEDYSGLKSDFLRPLIRGTGHGPNVRVIWYQLPPSERPISVFRRLNVGKIHLTSAELIRALFLSRQSGHTDLQKALLLRIAYQWDEIEKSLQADQLWYFIHEGPARYATRIEYLFAILMLQQDRRLEPGDHGLFITYHRYFQECTDPSALWKVVRELHLALQEWYEDTVFFHLVGTLVTLKTWGTAPTATSEEVIVDLLQKRALMTRDRLEAYIRREVLHQLLPRLVDRDEALEREELAVSLRERLASMAYPDSPQRRPIRGTLLLFNSATLLRHGSQMRFRFDKLKNSTQGWDIEHIRSVRSEMPGTVPKQRRWLENVCDYWHRQPGPSEDGSRAALRATLHAEAGEILAQTPHDKRAFENLYLRILELFGERETSEVDNGLGNLALLDASTNRRFGNAVFPIKRREVCALDKTGTFTPPCTTNAFLKYYSKNPRDMFFWKEEDRADYFEAIWRGLLDFFCPDTPATAPEVQR